MSFKRHHRIGAALAALVLIVSLTARSATLAPMTRAATLPPTAAVATDPPMPTATTMLAPTATATAILTPTATATPMPKAALTITPATANGGGLVTVWGSGFAAQEIVTISLSGTAATARADVRGVLPPTGI